LDTAVQSPTIPEVWCRRILAALSQRRTADRSAVHLEILLTYFIEMKPGPEGFGDLLARHADSGRAGLAEAAQVLQRAWQDGHGAEHVAGPPLQETLRTLGARIDDAGVRAAYLTVTPDTAQIQTLGQLSECTLDPLELRLEIAARTTLRGQIAAPAPHAPVRYETRLRAVAADLMDAPEQAYELFVTPRTVVVEGSDGYYRPWTLDDVLAALPAGASPAAVGVG
jgi:hypothetical protein